MASVYMVASVCGLTVGLAPEQCAAQRCVAADLPGPPPTDCWAPRSVGVRARAESDSPAETVFAARSAGTDASLTPPTGPTGGDCSALVTECRYQHLGQIQLSQQATEVVYPVAFCLLSAHSRYASYRDGLWGIEPTDHQRLLVPTAGTRAALLAPLGGRAAHHLLY